MTLLLTIGPEYNGSMYLYHNAEKSADLFEETILLKIQCETIKIRGEDSTENNITKTISELSNRNDLRRIIIYYSGHGNHYANREYWQTSQGNIDQIKIAELVNNIKPLVVIISDSCSSEHMINSKFIHHPYITFGATLDNQDAIMTGDGGLFTLSLIESIKELDLFFTFNDLIDSLNRKKIDIETFSHRYSDNSILSMNFFHEI